MIVDMVFNQMAGGSGVGTGGCSYDAQKQEYPCVPYSTLDFHHPVCDINNYQNVSIVRNCYLSGMPDINQGKDWAREKISDYANKLLSYGVKGLRIDASKHMWPDDLVAIQVKQTE